MKNVQESSDEAEADKRAEKRTKTKFDPNKKLKPGPSVAQLKDRHKKLQGAKVSLRNPRTAKGTDKEVEEAVYSAYRDMGRRIDEILAAVAKAATIGGKVVGKVGSAIVKGGAAAIKQRAVDKAKKKMINRVRGVEEAVDWEARKKRTAEWKKKGSPKNEPVFKATDKSKKEKIKKLKEEFAGKMASKLGGEKRGKTTSKDHVVVGASKKSKEKLDKKLGVKTNPKGKDMVQMALNRRQAAAKKAGKGTSKITSKDWKNSRRSDDDS